MRRAQARFSFFLLASSSHRRSLGYISGQGRQLFALTDSTLPTHDVSSSRQRLVDAGTPPSTRSLRRVPHQRSCGGCQRAARRRAAAPMTPRRHIEAPRAASRRWQTPTSKRNAACPRIGSSHRRGQRAAEAPRSGADVDTIYELPASDLALQANPRLHTCNAPYPARRGCQHAAEAPRSGADVDAMCELPASEGAVQDVPRRSPDLKFDFSASPERRISPRAPPIPCIRAPLHAFNPSATSKNPNFSWPRAHIADVGRWILAGF
ncbi:hypothetical protein DFH06DRAFT_1147343 [Mycena polygramma]|nr:hypothetical protein DFH06DRAFT_1147343 [Mycena polygramma]